MKEHFFSLSVCMIFLQKIICLRSAWCWWESPMPWAKQVKKPALLVNMAWGEFMQPSSPLQAAHPAMNPSTLFSASVSAAKGWQIRGVQRSDMRGGKEHRGTGSEAKGRWNHRHWGTIGRVTGSAWQPSSTRSAEWTLQPDARPVLVLSRYSTPKKGFVQSRLLQLDGCLQQVNLIF